MSSTRKRNQRRKWRKSLAVGCLSFTPEDSPVLVRDLKREQMMLRWREHKEIQRDLRIMYGKRYTQAELRFEAIVENMIFTDFRPTVRMGFTNR